MGGEASAEADNNAHVMTYHLADFSPWRQISQLSERSILKKKKKELPNIFIRYSNAERVAD